MPLTVSIDGPVGVLSLDRAVVLDDVLAGEIVGACQTLRADSGILAVVVMGIFGCDMDPDSVPTGFASDSPPAGARSAAALAGLPVPSIAAVDGIAEGVGAELALACDIRVASETAGFHFQHLSRGMLPEAGGTQQLPRIAGRARALELLLLGEPLDAEGALRAGLVSRVVPPEQLLDEALKLAQRVARNAPVAVRYTREAVEKGMDLTLDQGMRLEADLSFLLQTTADRVEGIRAFLEKRPPVFRGE